MLTTELNITKQLLTVYFARLSNNLIKGQRYGFSSCKEDIDIMQELLLYQWVLTFWQQYEDGTPVPSVNFISQDEFNVIIDRIKFLIET